MLCMHYIIGEEKNAMQRRVWSVVLVAVALTLASVALWAHPISIKCPIDGQDMFFDHQVGYGEDAYCWYSHIANVPSPDGSGMVATKHEAYVLCGD